MWMQAQKALILLSARRKKDLGIKIHIEKCPANADNRQAKIATLLTSGDDSVDLITVNDEMISEFKHKGFLLPLEDTVMTEETAANFLQEYLKEICMSDGHIFRYRSGWISWHSG